MGNENYITIFLLRYRGSCTSIIVLTVSVMPIIQGSIQPFCKGGGGGWEGIKKSMCMSRSSKKKSLKLDF